MNHKCIQIDWQEQYHYFLSHVSVVQNCITEIHFNWVSSLLSNKQPLRCGCIINWCTTEWKCSYLYFLL